MKHSLLEVGALYDVAYLGPNLTILELKGARLVSSSAGPGGDQYQFERRDGRRVAVEPDQILGTQALSV